MNVILLMYVVRPFHWYKVCVIWWKIVHEWWMYEEHVWRFEKISRNALWSIISRLACGYVFARASILKPDLLRFRCSAILILPFPIYFHYASYVPHAIPCFVFIFLPIEKIISHKILVQIEWNFLCHDPCNVLYFMKIFPGFVHVWILKWPRVCSCMWFHAPCLVFWSWNDDA